MNKIDIVQVLETRFDETESNSEKILIMDLLATYYNKINNECSNGFIIPSKLHLGKVYKPAKRRYSSEIEYRKIFYYNGITSKICSDCDTIKPITEYYKAKNMITKRQHICKTCFKIKYI